MTQRHETIAKRTWDWLYISGKSCRRLNYLGLKYLEEHLPGEAKTLDCESARLDQSNA